MDCAKIIKIKVLIKWIRYTGGKSMKKPFMFLLVVCAAQNANIDAKKSTSEENHSINVRTNLSPKRGKVYLKVYPYTKEGEEDTKKGKKDSKNCKKIKQNLPHKGSRTVTVPISCCWGELKIGEISKKYGRKRVLGRVTVKELVCTHSSTMLDIKEGKKEEGMAMRPIDIEAQLKKNKKGRKTKR
jgi:hypothetical protein